MSTGQKNHLPDTESLKEHSCESFVKLSAMAYQYMPFAIFPLQVYGNFKLP